MKKVLVVGDDNSCRSRMIAALMKHISFNRIDVTSAGITTGKIEPMVLKVLQEIGVNIEQEKSKSLNEFILTNYEYIEIFRRRHKVLPISNIRTIPYKVVS